MCAGTPEDRRSNTRCHLRCQCGRLLWSEWPGQPGTSAIDRRSDQSLAGPATRSRIDATALRTDWPFAAVKSKTFTVLLNSRGSRVSLEREVFMRTVYLCAILAALCGCQPPSSDAPTGPPTMPSWSEPNLGTDPTVYGPQRQPPCNGPHCPRR